MTHVNISVVRYFDWRGKNGCDRDYCELSYITIILTPNYCWGGNFPPCHPELRLCTLNSNENKLDIFYLLSTYPHFIGTA